MSKPNHKAARLESGNTEATNPAVPAAPTGRHTTAEQKTQTSRAVKAGGGTKRGDQRDTHPSFATGKAGRGSNTGPKRDGGRAGALGASGRKSGPKSDSAK